MTASRGLAHGLNVTNPSRSTGGNGHRAVGLTFRFSLFGRNDPLNANIRGDQIVALDRPDIFLAGDLALRRAAGRAYGFDHLPTEDEMVQLAERWRPHRSLAVSYLFASEYEAQP